jgi:hypothetical protein
MRTVVVQYGRTETSFRVVARRVPCTVKRTRPASLDRGATGAKASGLEVRGFEPLAFSLRTRRSTS